MSCVSVEMLRDPVVSKRVSGLKRTERTNPMTVARREKRMTRRSRYFMVSLSPPGHHRFISTILNALGSSVRSRVEGQTGQNVLSLGVVSPGVAEDTGIRTKEPGRVQVHK